MVSLGCKWISGWFQRLRAASWLCMSSWSTCNFNFQVPVFVDMMGLVDSARLQWFIWCWWHLYLDLFTTSSSPTISEPPTHSPTNPSLFFVLDRCKIDESDFSWSSFSLLQLDKKGGCNVGNNIVKWDLADMYPFAGAGSQFLSRVWFSFYAATLDLSNGSGSMFLQAQDIAYLPALRELEHFIFLSQTQWYLSSAPPSNSATQTPTPTEAQHDDDDDDDSSQETAAAAINWNFKQLVYANSLVCTIQ